VGIKPQSAPKTLVASEQQEGEEYVGEATQPVALADAAEIPEPPPTDDDSGMLLIDFR
jgi:hypothetical protein